MDTLKDIHPKVFAEFLKGNFVIKKTGHRFSAIDQDLEQSNAAVKDDGGAVEGSEGGGGGPNPISQEIVFFKSHNPSLCCSN